MCFQFSEAHSFQSPKLLSFYFYSLCLNWDPHSLLLSFNNLRVTWRAFVWETFQAKPRQQFRERFLFVDKNILKQPRELLLFHIIIFNVSLDMYEMPFSSCGRITFLPFAVQLLLSFCAAFPLSNVHPRRLYKHEQYLQEYASNIIHRSTQRFVSSHGPDTLHTLCHLFIFWPQSGENVTPVHSGRSQRTAESPAGGEAEPCAATAHG